MFAVFNVFRCERVPHDRSIILTIHLRPFAPTLPRLRSGQSLHLRWEWEKDIFSADWDVAATIDDNSANAQLRLLTMRKTMVAVVLVPSRHTDSATLRARWAKAATQLALRDFRNVYICFLDVHKVGTGGADRTFDRLAKASTQPLDKEKPGVVLVRHWASFDDDEGGKTGPGLDTVERYDGPAYQVKGIVSQMRIVSTPRADVEINDVDLLREKIKMFPTVVHMFLDGSLASFKKTRKRFARVAAASGLRGSVMFSFSDDPSIAPALDAALLAPDTPRIVAFKNYGTVMDTMALLEPGKSVKASAVVQLAESAVEYQRWKVPIDLDLLDRQMLNYLFRVKLPKVYVLGDMDTRKRFNVVETVTKVMHEYTPQTVAQNGGGQTVVFRLIEPSTQADIVNVFRVQGAKEGAILLHDTMKDQKHTLRGPPTEARLRRVLSMFLNGVLRYDPNDYEVIEIPALLPGEVEALEDAALLDETEQGGQGGQGGVDHSDQTSSIDEAPGVSGGASSIVASNAEGSTEGSSGAAAQSQPRRRRQSAAGGNVPMDAGTLQTLTMSMARLESEMKDLRVSNERLRNKQSRLEGRLAAQEVALRELSIEHISAKQQATA